MGTIGQIEYGRVNIDATIRSKFVQVTGLFQESCYYNTGKVIVDRLCYYLKDIFWKISFIFTWLGTILCLCLNRQFDENGTEMSKSDVLE